LQTCTATNVCYDLGNVPVTTPTDVPSCATYPDAGPNRGAFDDGPPLSWNDDNGDTRYACVHVPNAGAARLPLVVFLHGSHGAADDLYNYTSLRTKSDSYSLSATGGPTGFAVASLQGRNLHWEGPNPDGAHFDWMYRDLGSPSTNPDLRSIDHLVETLVATGQIDPNRIYITGWSNGAFESQMYALARYDTASPGLAGPASKIAAAVPYAGADPFGPPDDQLPDCQLASYPPSQVPILSVHRSCDALVPCDQDQLNTFAGDGGIPPGYAVEPWLSTLEGNPGDGDANVTDLIIGTGGATTSSCEDPHTLACNLATGALNHLHWPDGIADRSGVDHEIDMLNFMQAHPHP
jgi:poly(3-hydroxybutyrate) depolymerase